MTVSLTAAYGAVLALIVLALGINVTVHRAKLKVSLGDDGNPAMLRMIRLHGNAAEYVPLALLLMAVYEINGGVMVQFWCGNQLRIFSISSSYLAQNAIDTACSEPISSIFSTGVSNPFGNISHHGSLSRERWQVPLPTPVGIDCIVPRLIAGHSASNKPTARSIKIS